MRITGVPYPFDSLASKVLGFTGGDNQGIIGLEAAYESILKRKERNYPHYDGCGRSRSWKMRLRSGSNQWPEQIYT